MEVPSSTGPSSRKTFADTTKSSSVMVTLVNDIRSYNINHAVNLYSQDADVTYNVESKQINIKSKSYTRLLFIDIFATGGGVSKYGTCKVGYVTSDNNIIGGLTLSLMGLGSSNYVRNTFVIPRNTTLSFGVRAIGSGSTAPSPYVDTFKSNIKIV